MSSAPFDRGDAAANPASVPTTVARVSPDALSFRDSPRYRLHIFREMEQIAGKGQRDGNLCSSSASRCPHDETPSSTETTRPKIIPEWNPSCRLASKRLAGAGDD